MVVRGGTDHDSLLDTYVEYRTIHTLRFKDSRELLAGGDHTEGINKLAHYSHPKLGSLAQFDIKKNAAAMPDRERERPPRRPPPPPPPPPMQKIAREKTEITIILYNIVIL